MEYPIIALDIGERRTGVAVNPTGSVILELPTLRHQLPDEFRQSLEQLLEEHHPTMVVIGQSRTTQYEDQIRELIPTTLLTIVDETLTTKEAERQLTDERHMGTGDSDARAARLILEQYLRTNNE